MQLWNSVGRRTSPIARLQVEQSLCPVIHGDNRGLELY